MSLGSTLREARERKGLTIAQVAEQTRMIHQLVEEIEQDDFHRISAPIYGRGFIKLFAECVDEDPAPLMQEFTEIYTGLRRPGVRTRPVQTPVERPEVAEPKDRNAPPPRPKVRAVVLAEDDADASDTGRDAPAARPSEPVESPKSEVKSPADTGRDASTARPSEPVESPKSEVESPADTGRDAPTARPPEPAESPKAEVESPADTGRDASTARPSEPVESPKPEVESPADTGRDAPTARPSEPAESPKPEVETPADTGRDAPTARPPEPVESPLSEVESPVDAATDEPKDDDSLLGELFDLVARKRSQRSEESSSSKHDDKDESSVKISLPKPAPSWDDAPLEEDGDFWQKLYNLNKWKYWKVSAALAGLCLLAVIVFAVVVNRHPKPETADSPDVSQTTAISEPQPEPQPEQAPAELSTHNSQLSTPSAGDAAASPADGRTVYTANLIPPPDSYVD